jgi:hypothetical protein
LTTRGCGEFFPESWACSTAVLATADMDCCAIRIVNRPVLGFPLLSVNDIMTSTLLMRQPQ